MNYAVEVVPDVANGRPCYMASHPDLPGCMSHGDTPQAAIKNLAAAKAIYVATLLDRGLPIPLPVTASTVVWEIL